ncbi:uncharacterized protein LOC144537867 [Centroberyx gerrardi]
MHCCEQTKHNITLLKAAIMSRIICVTLLFIILAHICCDNTVSSAALRGVTKEHIRNCLCKVLPNGRKKCHHPPFPGNPAELQGLIECFCSKRNQRKFVECQPGSRSGHRGYRGIPIPLA